MKRDKEVCIVAAQTWAKVNCLHSHTSPYTSNSSRITPPTHFACYYYLLFYFYLFLSHLFLLLFSFFSFL